MYITKFYLKAEDIRNQLPEQYKDSEIFFVSSKVSSLGQELELECVVIEDSDTINDARNIRYRFSV